jgi:hypothetical protein
MVILCSLVFPGLTIAQEQSYKDALQSSAQDSKPAESTDSRAGREAYIKHLRELSGEQGESDEGKKHLEPATTISSQRTVTNSPAPARVAASSVQDKSGSSSAEISSASVEEGSPAVSGVDSASPTKSVSLEQPADSSHSKNNEPATTSPCLTTITCNSSPAASCDSYCQQLRGIADGNSVALSVPTSAKSSESTTERNFVKNLAFDQMQIWESPFRMQLSDAKWAVPLAGITTGLIVTDRRTSFELSRGNHINLSNDIANGGIAAMGSVTAGIYFLGKVDANDHQRETGLLIGEAALDSMAVDEVFKYAFGRNRPTEGDQTGHFFRGGQSFYSDHSTVAWAAASVLTSEYPGWFSDLGAYGAATAISLARVTGRQHYLSDVFVGASTGYLIGKHVYRVRHSPELAAQYGTFVREKSPLSPGNTGSTYIPLDSWIYPALDRLIGIGVIRTQFMGIRPWTRIAVAEMLEDAQDRGGDDLQAAADIVARLRSEFAEELGIEEGTPLESIRLDSAYTRLTNISGSVLNDSYHFGQTLINDFGRPYGRGFNEVSGFTSRAETGRFAFYVRGEYQHAPGQAAYPLSVREVIANVDENPLQPPTSTPAANQFRLLDTYVSTALLGNEISVGKQSLWWGPDFGGAMLLSDNAEPFYSVRINRTTPFMIPGLSRVLGPFRYDNVFGRLAGHNFPPRPFYYAQKVSFKPTENLEFGFSRSAVFAGQGLTPLTFYTFFHSLTSVTSGGDPTDPVARRQNPGARFANFDFSYRLPWLRNWLTLYSDSAVHDDVSPVDSPRRAAINPGIYLSHLPKLPKLDFRVEAVSTDPENAQSELGQFIYWEELYHDATTNKGYLLGDWIGREGKGGQTWLTYWLSPTSNVQFGYRNAKVAKDFIPFGETQNNYFVKTVFRLRPEWELNGMLQFESWKAPLLAPGLQRNVVSSLQLTFFPKNLKLQHTE